MPSPRDLDRAAEVLLQRALFSDTAIARTITRVLLAVAALGVTVGAAVLARGPVCEALDRAAGGVYCEARSPARTAPAGG